MGICYKLFLEDEFDWGYLDTTKEDRLKEFEEKWDGYIERIVGWYGFVVYDIGKSTPYLDKRTNLIREYADKAYYTTDLGVGITELELPRNKPSVQAEIDDMASRRTAEEKKVSEELCRQKLEKMEIR